jgi:hypothetical protein
MYRANFFGGDARFLLVRLFESRALLKSLLFKNHPGGQLPWAYRDRRQSSLIIQLAASYKRPSVFFSPPRYDRRCLKKIAAAGNKKSYARIIASRGLIPGRPGARAPYYGAPQLLHLSPCLADRAMEVFITLFCRRGKRASDFA